MPNNAIEYIDNVVTIVWNDGAILYSTGEIEDSTQYKYSDLIPVNYGYKYDFTNFEASGGSFVVAMYEDGGLTPIRKYSTRGNPNVTHVNGIIPTGVDFIRVCCLKTSTGRLVLGIPEDAHYTPDIPDGGGQPVKSKYNPTGSFRFWCQKVLPTVYDDSLSYYEVLCKVANYLNIVIQNVDALNDSIDSTNEAFETLKAYVNSVKDTMVNTYNELQTYINTYFDSLDVQNEINEKLDTMASTGALNPIVSPYIPSVVQEWLEENITPTTPTVDASLTISGAAADARVTGKIRELLNGAIYTNRYDPIYTYSSGVILTEDGSIAESSQYIVSQPIKVFQGADVYYRVYGTPSCLPVAFFETENSNAIINKSVRGTNVQGQTGHVVAPEGANYMRICSYASYENSIVGTLTYTSIKLLREELTRVEDYLRGITYTGRYVPNYRDMDGVVLASDGSFVNGGAYTSTTLVEVFEGVKIHYRTYGSTSVFVVAFYTSENSNAILTGSVKGTQVEGQTGVVTVPSGVKYARLVCDDSYVSNRVFILTYPSIKDLNEKIDSVTGGTKVVTLSWNDGTILVSDGQITPSSQYHYSDAIPVEPGQRYNYNGWYGSPAMYVVAMYETENGAIDSTHSITGRAEVGTQTGIIPDNVHYIRVSSYNSHYLTSTLTISNPSTDLTNNLIRLATIRNFNPLGGYIHSRRATIAFMMDGEYDRNRQCYQALKDHGMVGTFAIQWDTNFANNSLADYLEWQSEGFEIGCHSSQAVGTQSGAGTDAQVATIIRNSKKVMTNYGFKVSTFTSLQGSTRVSAYPVIKAHYECGFCKTNHYGSDRPLLNIEVDPPYELWRYSLESSSDDQIVAAVDQCVANNGCLIFYWHARSNNELYNVTRFNQLLDYVATKLDAQVVTAYEAVSDYYSVRREDLS